MSHRVRPLHFAAVLTICGAFVLAAVASPRPVQAQRTCVGDEQYCPSGSYAGQCRPPTTSCPLGSVAARVDGCVACACPAGKALCTVDGVAQCVDSVLGRSCTTADGQNGTYTDACGTTCAPIPPDYVVLAPRTTQTKTTTMPLVSANQEGAGLLLNLQKARKSIFSVDGTGLQVGWDPDGTKNGADLSGAGGQNLIFGIARAFGMDQFLDSLLLIQIKDEDGVIRDQVRIQKGGRATFGNSKVDLDATNPTDSIIRLEAKRSGMHADDAFLSAYAFNDDGTGQRVFHVNKDGKVRGDGGFFTINGDYDTTNGKVKGASLCFGLAGGGSDCKTSWADIRGSPVNLQDTTPGTVQTGHLNISGTGTVGALTVNGGSLTLRPPPSGSKDTRITAIGRADDNGSERLLVDSDGSVEIRIDADQDITEQAFHILNSIRQPLLTVIESGNTQVAGSITVGGRGVFRGAPGGTQFADASFFVNPLSAPVGSNLLGLGVNGTPKFRVDAEGDATAYGTFVVIGSPTGAGVTQGSITVNPGSAPADATLLGVAVASQEKFKVDTEGDATIAGTLRTTGGGVIGGSTFTVGGQGVLAGRMVGTRTCTGVTSCLVGCGSASERAIGGGCSVSSGAVTSTRPGDAVTQWSCGASTATTISAYVICARFSE